MLETKLAFSPTYELFWKSTKNEKFLDGIILHSLVIEDYLSNLRRGG